MGCKKHRFTLIFKSSNERKKISGDVAQPTRLELATSCVTGRRSNQLNYGCTTVIMVGITRLELVTSTL